MKKTSPWTILEILKWTTEYFSANQIDSPRLTAEILLAETLGIDRIGLYVRFDQPLTDDERHRFKALVKRRLLREPVAYILGRKDFWKIELILTPAVLIPRPETEILVETAIAMIQEGPHGNFPGRILDLGTGSGAIIISLAHAMPEMKCFASDISRAALDVASRNAVLNKVDKRISFFASRWFDSISTASPFHMIVSNPPYIPSSEIPELAPEIFAHEPVTALDGDTDGLRDIGVLVAEGPGYLVAGGSLIIEIGHDQKRAVENMVERQKGCDLFFRKDYSGHDRVAVITRRG